MTAKTLEEEAREAAERYRESCSLDAVGERQLHDEVIGYGNGYLAAATLREKELSELCLIADTAMDVLESRNAEIASLRAKLEAVPVEDAREVCAMAENRIRWREATFPREVDFNGGLRVQLDAFRRWLASVPK